MALKKRSRVLLGVLAVFLVLLLTAGLIVGRIASLALTDTMQEKYTIVEHEDTFLQTLLTEIDIAGQHVCVAPDAVGG